MTLADWLRDDAPAGGAMPDRRLVPRHMLFSDLTCPDFAPGRLEEFSK